MNRTTEEITRTQIVRFAGAAGDFNPMHHDEPFARAAGQPSVFAMGQLSAAILGAAVAEWLGRDNVAAYGVRFTGKVWPGDRLEIECEPVGEGRYELRMARASDGAVVVTGWARARTASGTSESESAIRSS
ncbi:MAG TPA: MaoC/PaaZ C-terminal domain-containing protein [Thermoleophilaceae bacterium]|jgi:acyl dehydratase|nr:MaoC/PaaZ C-terminal domain-containing protein [Thermoleophilaceae bacterium]